MSAVELIDSVRARELLKSCGLTIGQWNEVRSSSGQQHAVCYTRPNAADALFVFSRYLISWLQVSPWVLVQFDNSTALDDEGAAMLQRLVPAIPRFSSRDAPPLDKRTLLFDTSAPLTQNDGRRILADLVFALLLFEAHAQFVSLTAAGDYLSVQDGVVNFYTSLASQGTVKRLLEQFESSPNLYPKSWP